MIILYRQRDQERRTHPFISSFNVPSPSRRSERLSLCGYLSSVVTKPSLSQWVPLDL